MLWTVFGKKGLRQKIPAFLGNSILLGGILTAFPFGKGVLVMAAVALMAVVGIRRFWGRFFYVQKIKQHLCNVLLEFRGIEKEAVGLLDTGNQLKDPLSKHPVIVVAENLMQEYIETAELFAPECLVWIPYTSVGGNGLIQGVRLTKAVLITAEKEYVHRNVIAACGRKDLFCQKPYQMILHTELLQA